MYFHKACLVKKNPGEEALDIAGNKKKDLEHRYIEIHFHYIKCSLKEQNC